jgi:curli biogenesis system outer membrane secretion channel CsgG
MKSLNNIRFLIAGSVAALALLSGCLTDSALAPNRPSVNQNVAHACPEQRPRVAVARFDSGVKNMPAEIGPGLTDMLLTAMTETGCYRMLDSTTIAEVAQQPGQAGPDLARRAGADLFVVGRVTAFEPDASGASISSADAGGSLSQWLHSAGFDLKGSRISLALRLVDPATGEVVTATTLTGIAPDLGASVQESRFGLSLAAYAKTPMGEAMRSAIDQAVQFLLARTPTRATVYQQALATSPR